MAQPIVNGSIVLGRFVWEKEGHHAFVCRRFRISPRPAGSTTLDAAVLLDHQFAPLLCSCVAAAWNYIGVWCRCLLPTWDGSPDETWNDGPYAPFGSGDPLPGQVAGLLTLKTATVPKPRTGHIYLPPPDESGNDAGVPSAGYMAALSTLATWLESTHQEIIPGFFTPLGARAAVWSFGSSVGSEVVEVTPSVLWATQGRRSGTKKTVGSPTEPGPGVE